MKHIKQVTPYIDWYTTTQGKYSYKCTLYTISLTHRLAFYNCNCANNELKRYVKSVQVSMERKIWKRFFFTPLHNKKTSNGT